MFNLIILALKSLCERMRPLLQLGLYVFYTRELNLVC
jgi:hypothetical protein